MQMPLQEFYKCTVRAFFYASFFIFSVFFTVHNSVAQNVGNLVSYAGNAGKERFNAVVQLSNGTILIGGSADNLDWLPTNVVKTPLITSGLNSVATGKTAFIIQVSADLSQVLACVHFPQNTAADVFKIKTNTLAGQATGDIFISGTRKVADYNFDGYFIAKLNNNFVKGIPTGTTWLYNAICKPRQSGGFTGESEYKTLQPWDVGGDGKVVFGAGAEFDFSWAEIRRLNTQGNPEVVENWSAHWSATAEWDGTPASSYPNAATAPLQYSAIVLKAGRKGSLRSRTAAEFSATFTDGNGNAGRKGTFPDDYYFTAACELTATGTCPSTTGGYTGYKTSDKPTQRLGSIAIDRRSNHIYIGYSTQTKLPDGLPDFEPAVVAFDQTGKIKWWNRLYQEQAQNSTPDQYVDGLAIDYKSNQLVVLARCHGNNTFNFWRGNSLAANTAALGFQNQFTGTSGNIHISWLGKLTLAEGQARHATYVAEYAEGANNYGAALTNPNLDGWPSPNMGWPNLNTTRMVSNGLSVSADGAVTIVGAGRRTFTTRNAYQKMPKPTSPAKGVWNNFVRTYAPDLSRPLYSSLLVGTWDTLTGVGSDNIKLTSTFKIDAGLLVVGFHRTDSTNVNADGRNMPTTAVPTWGKAAAQGESAVIARLVADSIKTNERIVLTSTLETQGQAAVEGLKIFPNPTRENAFFVEISAEMQAFSALKVEIQDALGRTIATQTLNTTGDLLRVDVQEIETKGWFFVRISNPQGKVLGIGKVLKN
jgi:hypothetical protein